MEALCKSWGRRQCGQWREKLRPQMSEAQREDALGFRRSAGLSMDVNMDAAFNLGNRIFVHLTW